MIIVLAGNREQFLRFAKGDKQYVFGDRPEQIRGHSADDVVEIGTFWMRKDADELRDFARQCVRPV